MSDMGRFRKLTMFVLFYLCLFQVNVNMLNVNYLLETKKETKNSAAPVAFKPETLAVPKELVAGRSVELTFQLV